jgi:hypothetical protein
MGFLIAYGSKLFIFIGILVVLISQFFILFSLGNDINRNN